MVIIHLFNSIIQYIFDIEYQNIGELDFIANSELLRSSKIICSLSPSTATLPSFFILLAHFFSYLILGRYIIKFLCLR